MSHPASIAICLSTVESPDQARQIAASLIDQGLAACVQIDGPIESHYPWNGQVCCDQEYRLVIKTATASAKRLREHLRTIHPYDVPQIVTVPSLDVDPDYEHWVQQHSGGEEG